jgi:hypothetical protein
MMFLQIAALGAAEVADDISDFTSKIGFADGSVVPTPDSVRQYLRGSPILPYLRALDVNGDGKVTFGEIFSTRNAGFNDLLPAVQRTMGLGAGHEDFGGIGVLLTDPAFGNPAAVGPATVCPAVPAACPIFPEPPGNQ